MCTQVYPDSALKWCKKHQFEGSPEEVKPLLTEAFTMLTKAQELVIAWLQCEGIIGGKKIAREAPSEPDGGKRSAEQIAMNPGSVPGADDSDQSLSRRRKVNAKDNSPSADAVGGAANDGRGGEASCDAVAANAAAVAKPAAEHQGGAAFKDGRSQQISQTSIPSDPSDLFSSGEPGPLVRNNTRSWSVSDNGGDGGDGSGEPLLTRNNTRSWPVSDNGGDGGDGGAAGTAHSGFGFGGSRQRNATALVTAGASCVGGAKTPSIPDVFGGIGREVLSQPVMPTGGSSTDAEDGGEAGCHGASTASDAERPLQPFNAPLGGVDGPVGPLEYVGRDLLNMFGDFFDAIASGQPRPATWQDIGPHHQSLILDAIDSLHEKLEHGMVISRTCLLPISLESWRSFRKGPLDQECVAFMVRTLLEALGIPLIGGAGRAAYRSKHLMLSRTSDFVAVMMIPPGDDEQWAKSVVECLQSVYSASKPGRRQMLVVTKDLDLIIAGPSQTQSTMWLLTRQGRNIHIDEQTRTMIHSLLKRAGLTKLALKCDAGGGPGRKKETSPFAMFIDLVRCLACSTSALQPLYEAAALLV